MHKSSTESMNRQSAGLDLAHPREILSAIVDGQSEAVQSLPDASPAIIAAARVAARTIQAGGVLTYAAAGSSGLMALSDALELPGTFGIARSQIRVLFAGGQPWLDTFRGGPEDDAALAIKDVAESGLSAKDCIIVVSASGSTPYAVAALQKAKEIGAATIAIANNENTPLLNQADTAILLATPPELVAGSTRMGAGTAQKIALNMISTLMAVELGHVVDGYMVNLTVDNAKLRSRAAGIIMNLGGCDEATALSCLDRCDGAVKAAILLVSGADSPAHAAHLVNNHKGNVRSALTELDQGKGPEKQRAL